MDTHRVNGMCAHTLGRHTIERCGNYSCVQNVVEKIGEDIWKVRTIGRVISQAFTQRSKHDKIRARWASSILLKNMLEKVWWCKHVEMESWRWTICYLMDCSKMTIKVCMLFWGGVGKGRCCYQLTLRFQKGKDIGQPWT